MQRSDHSPSNFLPATVKNKIRIEKYKGHETLWLKFNITEPDGAKLQPLAFICGPAPAK